MNELIKPLNEAYHAVFDYKDTREPGGDQFVKAADICRGINDLLVSLDAPEVQRFDGRGRP